MSETGYPELSKNSPMSKRRLEGRQEKSARELRPLLQMLADYTVKFDEVGRRMVRIVALAGADHEEYDPDHLSDAQWLFQIYPHAKKLAQHMSQKLESDLDDSIRIELELRLADFEVALSMVANMAKKRPTY